MSPHTPTSGRYLAGALFGSLAGGLVDAWRVGMASPRFGEATPDLSYLLTGAMLSGPFMLAAFLLVGWPLFILLRGTRWFRFPVAVGVGAVVGVVAIALLQGGLGWVGLSMGREYAAIGAFSAAVCWWFMSALPTASRGKDSQQSDTSLTSLARDQMSMDRRVSAIGLGIVILSLLWFFLGETLKSPTPFDSEVWKKHNFSVGDAYPRLSMADDLIRRGTLRGLKREQVLEMLGDPGDHGYFRSYDLVYWLGPERSLFGLDSEWLAIMLDKTTGLVESYGLVRD